MFGNKKKIQNLEFMIEGLKLRQDVQARSLNVLENRMESFLDSTTEKIKSVDKYIDDLWVAVKWNEDKANTFKEDIKQCLDQMLVLKSALMGLADVMQSMKQALETPDVMRSMKQALETPIEEYHHSYREDMKASDVYPDGDAQTLTDPSGNDTESSTYNFKSTNGTCPGREPEDMHKELNFVSTNEPVES